MKQPDVQQLPQEDVVFERLPFDAQEHDWKQEGYTIHCDARSCNQPFAHGSSIRSGMMLTGKRGAWQLVKEGHVR